MSDQALPQSAAPNHDEIVLAAYRDRTVSMLRRYARAAVELGRLPSLLGREFFRARVTSYTVQTFEDAIIFAFDMERCIEFLTPFERTILARLALQQFTQEDVARVMRIDRFTVQRRFLDAVDHLTEILLEHAMLNPMLRPRRGRALNHCHPERSSAGAAPDVGGLPPHHCHPERSSARPAPGFGAGHCGVEGPFVLPASKNVAHVPVPDQATAALDGVKMSAIAPIVEISESISLKACQDPEIANFAASA